MSGPWRSVCSWGCLLALVAAGCGVRRPVLGASPAPPDAGVAAPLRQADPAPPVGPAQGRSRPAAAQSLESFDQALGEALLRATVLPSADAYRAVAREYRRLGVLDMAHEYFSQAVALDPTDAASYDALARLWRDWGTPHLGLGDAYRAVYFAPASPSAANTLGTLLQALGRLEDARRWYAAAIALDPTAWYALNNLCYADIMSRQYSAIEACERAVAAAPDSPTAKNNLALAHAAAGQREMARTWFRRAGDPARASYNYGIAMMATRAYAEAAEAFREALQADPHFTLAAARARQARLAAQAEDDTRDHDDR